jgi:Tol biopolymer transport system component
MSALASGSGRAARGRRKLSIVLASLGGLGLGGVVAGSVGVAQGTALSARTLLLAPPFVVPNGPSAQPSISANGEFVAFASSASNLTGSPGAAGASGAPAAEEIYVDDDAGESVRLVSASAAGAPANGSSSGPSISGNGQTVAFVSTASNLVGGVAKGIENIYVETVGGPPVLVSVGVGGSATDGNSYQPTISANGRFVVFTSTADDLVAGDDNDKPDVFERDLARGITRRVSVASHGGQADGPSSNASVSGDGRYVTFASTSSNLVGHQATAAEEVYVHDTASNLTNVISVSSSGRRQNAAVASPFTQVSSISGDGRYVAFDSDATNLTRGGSNEHTNVYVRDRTLRRTALVSVSSTGGEGDNDSFSPAISPDGHFVIFDSLADDLAPDAAAGSNVYLRDLGQSETTTVDVTADSRARDPELGSSLLQQPVVAANGQFAVFESGADNLVSSASNGVENLYVRALAAPQTIAATLPPAVSSSRPAVVFHADDPFASLALCEIDSKRLICPLGRYRLPRLKRGEHRLSVAAGGAGMLFDPTPIVTHFRVG